MEQDLRKLRLKKAFLRIFSFLQYQKKVAYNRVLPLSEYFNDRVKKAKKLGWGEGSSCYDNVYIFGDVRVGRHTFVGPFCVLDGSGGLEIGSSCSISAGVHIYTHNSVKWAFSGGKESYEYAPVIIEDDCYIGPNAVITQGVKISKGAVVGACSFVNCDVPSFTKVAGIPAKKIGESKNMDYKKLQEEFSGGGG
ncbi:acyltransferase, partial [Helicobacter mesocricetorum]|uniref:acyltransferase n=1 Tax=Helicobacter mesocricetorum TaxID=87012 RepID=UPI000CF0625C